MVMCAAAPASLGRERAPEMTTSLLDCFAGTVKCHGVAAIEVLMKLPPQQLLDNYGNGSEIRSI